MCHKKSSLPPYGAGIGINGLVLQSFELQVLQVCKS